MNNYFASRGAAVRPRLHRHQDELQPQRAARDLGQVRPHVGDSSAATACSALPADPRRVPTRDSVIRYINNGSIGHTYTFSPTVLLDGVFGYQRMEQTVQGERFRHQLRRPTRHSRVERTRVRQSGFPKSSRSAATTGSAFPAGCLRSEPRRASRTSHNMTWTKGAHELRFGFDGVLNRMNHWQPELGARPSRLPRVRRRRHRPERGRGQQQLQRVRGFPARSSAEHAEEPSVHPHDPA